MFTAKDIVIKPIDSKASRAIVQRYHYSGKCTQNSQLHFGVFLNENLEGALQFGPSIDKRRMANNLGIKFNESIELNRMALSNKCPKNSESRALGICIRTIKKRYPHIRVIISFADACQCGDGTIYRASGFKLESYKKNTTIRKLPNGEIVADKTFNNNIKREYKGFKLSDSKPIVGYQMKYIYYIDKDLEKTHKSVPFDEIPEEVKMYKGIKRVEHESNASGFQSEESGAIPTGALQKKVAE